MLNVHDHETTRAQIHGGIIDHPGRRKAEAASTAGILERGRAQAFVAIVAANAREHFRSSDLPLLVSYVQAAVLGDQAAAELRNGAVIDGRPSPWLVVQEKCVRTLSALSLRLRLAPQSRLDPKTVGRHRGYEGPPPWVR